MIDSWIDWAAERWQDIVIPVAVFVVFLLVGLWVRRFAYRAFERWAKRIRWEGNEILAKATRLPSLLWCLIIAIYLSIEVSVLDSDWKFLAVKILWALFVVSVAVVAIGIGRELIQLYLGKLKAPPRTISLLTDITNFFVIIVAVLMLLAIWGAPTSPLVLAIGVVALALLLAFRDALSSFVAWFQLTASGQIKAGDYIKLESGEEGHVAEITHRNTRIESLNGGNIFIPNNKLIQSKIVNYGRPPKRAKEPFQFYTRLHLKELTSLEARSLRELADTLRTVPDSVIYYHTHHFLEEHHYLNPEPPNDFAIWVGDVLGDELLEEKLASIDTFDFPTLGALREKLVDVIEEHLSREPEPRRAPEGRELHFIKSVSIISPTAYIAHDLREFVEGLRKVSLGSLYLHIFECRLRLGRKCDDFSVWIENSLDEPELAVRIAQLDPYNYTLEDLRSSLIQLIEKRIK